MMNNQMYQPYGYGPQMNMYNQGAVYGNQPPVKRANPLTREEIAAMRQKTPFSLGITQDEAMRGICFHVDENGMPATITDENGMTTCTVCGKTWNSNELTQEQVQEATNHMLSLLQTIKLMYVNFPEQAAREFYQIIPLIEKVPQLYKLAADNFHTYEGYTTGYYGGQPSPFQLFGQIAGGNGFQNTFQYQQTQPMGGYPVQQPMYQPQSQQPAYASPYTQPTYPVQQQQQINPFDPMYSAQPAPMVTGGYAPTTPQGYAYAPGQQPAPTVGQSVAPAAAPAQQAKPEEVTTSGNHTP